jgi:RNA recognition motif-containing protein
MIALNHSIPLIVGGVDLLLHLLTNITHLPVTKSIVKESGMGKAIGSIGKNKICAGTPNEGAIKERVSEIMTNWNKSVKARKETNQIIEESPETTRGVKRELDSSVIPSSPSSKKAKADDTKKSSFASLLKKMGPSSPNTKIDAREYNAASGDKPHDETRKLVVSASNVDTSKKASQKKQHRKRVKWADHFGGNLTAAKIIEDGEAEVEENEDDSSVSWSDRRKRDRLREKELLAKAKYVILLLSLYGIVTLLTHRSQPLVSFVNFNRKSKLLDDDDDGMGRQVTAPPLPINPAVVWHAPLLLPERSDVAPPQINSNETITQTTRMASVVAAKFASEYVVPSNPSPLSDVEQALDMTSQSSTVTQSMPFFVTQILTPLPAAPAAAPQVMQSAAPVYATQQSPSTSGVATAESVQSLGLPMFLVGQNLQALQTLASTPSLLSTFVDSNGMYDHVRLMNLVQTLSQNSATGHQQQASTAGFQQPGASGFGAVSTGAYGPASGGGGIYGPASASPAGFGNTWQTAGNKTTSYRGTQNNGEGNLHLSGYGPGTSQSEIIALFSPYVPVEEVVMKGTFCFINTNDPVGAQRAREALNGALLGGQPVRINMAQRKTRENAVNDAFVKGAATGGSYYGHTANPGSVSHDAVFPPAVGAINPGFPLPSAQPAPVHIQGQIPGPLAPQMPGPISNDISNVRDDRGNPATKNLFVAGYGSGTSEVQLREIFGTHCTIIGIIMKGTFCFINTTDKGSAIRAREFLSGSLLNGGVLRINFAKETGRLGTSFDLTYGQNPSGGRSHYGRGGY